MNEKCPKYNETGWVGRVVPVLEPALVRAACMKPYPNHPHGCPNYGKRASCPPQAPILDHTFDLSKPIYAIVNIFPLGEHRRRMAAKHPDWSERQLICCLYWQPKARRQLMDRILDWQAKREDGHRWHPVLCPEAQGVNLTRTLSNAGFDLEWPPQERVCQVALLGARP